MLNNRAPGKSADERTYPRREPSGWQIAPGTSFIPDDWWHFFDGTANQEAPFDDLLWAINAVQFIRVEWGVLHSQWSWLRTPEQIKFVSRLELAIRLAMNRVFHVAPLYLTPEECDRIASANAIVKEGLKAYFDTSTAIRLAGGDAATPEAVDLFTQAHALWRDKANSELADLLRSVNADNPFDDPAIDMVIRDGGVLDRLLPKLLRDHKAAHERVELVQKQEGPTPEQWDAMAAEGLEEHYKTPAGAKEKVALDKFKRDLSKGRRGRMPKNESEARKAAMIAYLVKHPSMKDDIPALAKEVDADPKTVKAWLEEMETQYREGPPPPKARK